MEKLLENDLSICVFYIYVNLLADVTIFEGKECGNTLSFEGHVSNMKGWDMHH